MKHSNVGPNIIALIISACLLTSCAWFTKPEKAETGSVPVSANKTPNAAGEVTNAQGQPYYVVQADFTPLYRSGPQQPNGPDQSLPKDTLVSVLKKGFGFSRVQLESGLNGYVATEDLQPATAERVTPPIDISENIINNSAIVERFSAGDNGLPSDTSMDNAEALPELPEPRLEPEPTPVEKPDFRY